MAEVNEDKATAGELSDKLNSLMKENKERRVSLEKDLTDINSRLDYNKKAMENARIEIEKITDILSNLREHTLQFEDVSIVDNWEETGALKPDHKNTNLITKCASQLDEMTSSLKETLQKRNENDLKSNDANNILNETGSRKSAEF